MAPTSSEWTLADLTDPGAARLEARLRDEGLTASSWGNGPGDRYAAHSHSYDKVLVATRGSITFHLVDTAQHIELGAGERLDLPAGTTHAATVSNAGVTCLEAHLPPGSLAPLPRHKQAGW